MTYSSAVFPRPDAPLEEAQTEKYRQLADRIGLQQGHSVLEIGCGWGGFAEWAARERGAHVTGLTISNAQHAYAQARIARAGLGERVDIRLQDYRDVAGQFDRIVSIEMFEAVGEAYWPAFFTSLRDRLKPDGVAGLQIITIADHRFDHYRRNPDFIQMHVFPGGMLPSPAALHEQCRQAGLAIREAFGFGQHYAQTLNEWHRRFQVAWPRLVSSGAGSSSTRLDDRFKRLWEQYLTYCEAGFRFGATDVLQLAITRA